MENTFKVNKLVGLIFALLILITSIISIIYSSEVYVGENVRNRLIMISWDWCLTLIVVPALVLSVCFFNRNEYIPMILSGILFYLLYNYMLYGFTLKFNFFFLNYTVLLGLSCYLFFFNIFKLYKKNILLDKKSNKNPKLLIVFVFFMGILFTTIWLIDLLPSILNRIIPSYCIRFGYITSYIHLIDLALVLPLFLLVDFYY